MLTIEDTEKRLHKMTAGQRAWFSYCPSLPIHSPRLLLRFLREDPDSRKLSSAQRTLSNDPFIMGMASLNANGQLQFLASSLNRSHLEGLAEWVKANVEEFSSLSCLKNCVVSEISSTGMLLSQHQDERLWENIPDYLAPYTVQESLYRLRKLKLDKDYWFWLTNKGPTGDPYFYLYPNQKSDSLKRLQKHIFHIRKLLESDAKAYSGAITREAEELLTLISFDSARSIFNSLTYLYNQDPKLFVELEKVRIIQNEKGSLSTIYRVVKDQQRKDTQKNELNTSLFSKGLEELKKGKKLYFWFDTKNLLLSIDRRELRDQAKQLGKSGIRGEVKQSSKGFVVFQTKQKAPDFMLSLVNWTNKHRSLCADLSILKGSRMIQRDEQGNAIDKQKADSAWL